MVCATAKVFKFTTATLLDEGIATTKGYKIYYEAHDPVGGVDANRTNFHVR